MFRRLLISLLFAAPLVFGQSGASDLPPASAVAHQYFYDGSGNLVYDCQGLQAVTASTFSIAAGTVAQIVVSGGTATITFGSTSYLWIGAQIQVQGSATAALNGTYKVTGVSGSTATFTTSASDATYTGAGLTVGTWSPLLNANAWAIKVFSYNGSNQLTGAYWAGVTQGAGGAQAPVPSNLPCSSRASY